jgi:hypothetical protein
LTLPRKTYAPDQFPYRPTGNTEPSGISGRGSMHL